MRIEIYLHFCCPMQEYMGQYLACLTPWDIKYESDPFIPCVTRADLLFSDWEALIGLTFYLDWAGLLTYEATDSCIYLLLVLVN